MDRLLPRPCRPMHPSMLVVSTVEAAFGLAGEAIGTIGDAGEVACQMIVKLSAPEAVPGIVGIGIREMTVEEIMTENLPNETTISDQTGTERANDTEETRL